MSLVLHPQALYAHPAHPAGPTTRSMEALIPSAADPVPADFRGENSSTCHQ
jgi:hypothetical protein